MKNNDYRLTLKRSVIPPIAAAAVWALFSLTVPWGGLQLAAALLPAAAAAFIASRVFPPRLERIAVARRFALSGNADADRIIGEARAVLRSAESAGFELAPLNASMASDLAGLIEEGDGILDYAADHPDRVTLLRRFTGYYLPTLGKLCRSYVELCRSDTAADTCAEIEKAVGEMKRVFERQKEKLIADQMLDISADIAVLDGLLASDALRGKKNEAETVTENEVEEENGGKPDPEEN